MLIKSGQGRTLKRRSVGSSSSKRAHLLQLLERREMLAGDIQRSESSADLDLLRLEQETQGAQALDPGGLFEGVADSTFASAGTAKVHGDPFASVGTELVVVDGGIDNHQELLSSLSLADDADPLREIEVLVVHSERDGIAQISDALRDRQDVTAVHLFSHGSEGSLRIGNSVLNSDSLDDYAADLYRWRESLAEGADILLYGCNVAG